MLRRGWCFWFGSLLLGCSTPEESPSAGSNTNWLTHCESDADCGHTTSCLCGGCTLACARTSDCDSLPGAVCVDSTADSVQVGCTDEAGFLPAGLCLPGCEPGSCGADLICSLGACVPFLTPELPLCSALGDPDRVLEDQLLLEVETRFSTGDLSCPDGSSLSASLLVTIAPELTCAARALAADILLTRSSSLVDSQGRTTSARLAEAGVTASRWAEGFAFGVDTATGGFARMLADAEFCAAVAGAGFEGIGVGVYGDSFVVLLAGP